jgi:flagellar biogenesis protein FliO
MGSASWAVSITGNYLSKLWRWLNTLAGSWRSRPSRQLRLQETLALGERRFIAVVEFERQKFLIAGTGSSVAMLTALPVDGDAKENRRSEAANEEVPTWAFNGNGPASQLIRR